MAKFIKAGRVVVILRGRYAGRKAVVVATHEAGLGDRKFGHVVVAGIDRAPKRITREMSKKKMDKRLTLKPFIKALNFSHFMPTRYNMDVQEKLKAHVVDDTLTSEEKRTAARKEIKKVLEDRYKALQTGKDEKTTSGVKYFFQKLHF